MVTVAEAAAMAGVSERTIYRMAWDGTLPSVKVGRSRRIRRADVEAMLTPGGAK